ncbi:MAG: hypothetical protein ACFB50_09690 [Rubrobacteraceae bacterium]
MIEQMIPAEPGWYATTEIYEEVDAPDGLEQNELGVYGIAEHFAQPVAAWGLRDGKVVGLVPHPTVGVIVAEDQTHHRGYLYAPDGRFGEAFLRAGHIPDGEGYARMEGAVDNDIMLRAAFRRLYGTEMPR